jgi:hypothetical protein
MTTTAYIFATSEFSMRWKEPFLTEGLNRKEGSSVSGIYRGFLLDVDPGAGDRTVLLAASSLGDSLAVYETSTRRTLTLRKVGDELLDLSGYASEVVVLALYATYATGATTTAVVRVYTELEFSVAAEKDEVLVLGTIDVPAATNAITAADISESGKSDRRLGERSQRQGWTQLLVNGSFDLAEEITAGTVYDWPGWVLQFPVPTYGIELFDVASSPGKAVVLNYDGAPTFLPTFVYQNLVVRVMAGQRIRFRFRYKRLQASTSGTPGSMTFVIGWVTLGTEYAPGILTDSVDTEYQEYEYVKKLTADDTIRFVQLGSKLTNLNWQFGSTAPALLLDDVEIWLEDPLGSESVAFPAVLAHSILFGASETWSGNLTLESVLQTGYQQLAVGGGTRGADPAGWYRELYGFDRVRMTTAAPKHLGAVFDDRDPGAAEHVPVLETGTYTGTGANARLGVVRSVYGDGVSPITPERSRSWSLVGNVDVSGDGDTFEQYSNVYRGYRVDIDFTGVRKFTAPYYGAAPATFDLTEWGRDYREETWRLLFDMQRIISTSEAVEVNGGVALASGNGTIGGGILRVDRYYIGSDGTSLRKMPVACPRDHASDSGGTFPTSSAVLDHRAADAPYGETYSCLFAAEAVALAFDSSTQAWQDIAISAFSATGGSGALDVAYVRSSGLYLVCGRAAAGAPGLIQSIDASTGAVVTRLQTAGPSTLISTFLSIATDGTNVLVLADTGDVAYSVDGGLTWAENLNAVYADCFRVAYDERAKRWLRLYSSGGTTVRVLACYDTPHTTSQVYQVGPDFPAASNTYGGTALEVVNGVVLVSVRDGAWGTTAMLKMPSERSAVRDSDWIVFPLSASFVSVAGNRVFITGQGPSGFLYASPPLPMMGTEADRLAMQFM